MRLYLLVRWPLKIAVDSVEMAGTSTAVALGGDCCGISDVSRGSAPRRMWERCASFIGSRTKKEGVSVEVECNFHILGSAAYAQ